MHNPASPKRPETWLSAMLSDGDPHDDPVRIAALASRLADRGEIAALLTPEIARIRNEPCMQPRFGGIEFARSRGLILHRGIDVTASLAVTDPIESTGAAASIRFMPGRSLVVFHNLEPAEIALHEVDTDADATGQFCAEEAGTCRVVEKRQVVSGDFLVLDRERQAMRIVAARGPIPFVRLFWRQRSVTPARVYRLPEGYLTSVAMAHDGNARAQLMTSVLRAMGRPVGCEIFDGLTRNEEYMLRWHTIRSWLAIDPASAVPRLEEMTLNDPHAAVRAAASQALAMVTERAA